MSLQFSVNNRYYGLGSILGGGVPTLCQMWFDLKSFLTTTAGWTVSQSGYSNDGYGSQFSANSDLITEPGYVAGGMASDAVWFILRSPDGIRELLFYRHLPIDRSSDTIAGSKISYRSAGQMSIAYSAKSKFSTNPDLGQGYAELTFPTASITAVDGLTGTATITIANNLKAIDVGNVAVITGGDVHAKNNGTYLITAVTPTSITILNPLASVDVTGNIVVTVREPLPVSGFNPPIANDLIWLHRTDLHDVNYYVNALGGTDINNWSGSTLTGDALNDYDIWNMHACAESGNAPYPFYFWITNKRDTIGFFSMDGLLDGNPNDPENVCFWFCPVTGGIGGSPTTGYNVLNGVAPTANQWSPHFMDITTQMKPRLRAWISKPNTFADRNAFTSAVRQNKCRFINVVIPMLTTFITEDSPNNLPAHENFYTFVPKGNSTSLYSSQDQLFPVMYFKYAALQTTPEATGSNSEQLAVPNMYKGRSVLYKMNSVIRNQFDTLTVTSTKDGIMSGSSSEIVLPWAGVSINRP